MDRWPYGRESGNTEEARPEGHGEMSPAKVKVSHCPVFDSLDECIAAVEGCIERQDADDARPCCWSRTPEDLAEAWTRGRQELQELASSD